MDHRIETKLIHAGELRPRPFGAVCLPVFQSAMFEYAGETSYHDLKYIRLSNTPNHTVLGAKLAALEGGEAGLVTGSGMAAISATLLALLRPGDHLITTDCLYGGTHDLIAGDLADLGIEWTAVAGADAAAWETALRPNTRAIYVETISNPLIDVCDLEGAVALARRHSLVSIVDNTFATPMLFRPPQVGFDLSLHSGTKYLNGHSDIVAGAVIGRADLVERVKRKLDHLGGSLDPHACFLLHRGLKTLAVRMRAHDRSALALARFLAPHPRVGKVNYPGLEDHPRHQRAVRLFDGAFGGMLSFEPEGGVEAARRLMARLEIPVQAPSLGGVETLVTRPATTSHAGMSASQRLTAGITDSLVRVSVGLEAAEDLIADFAQAL